MGWCGDGKFLVRFEGKNRGWQKEWCTLRFGCVLWLYIVDCVRCRQFVRHVSADKTDIFGDWNNIYSGFGGMDSQQVSRFDDIQYYISVHLVYAIHLYRYEVATRGHRIIFDLKLHLIGWTFGWVEFLLMFT